MRIKTYFAGTVEAALGLASRELGGDALLLAAHPAGIGSRHLGAYEVVIGVPGRGASPVNLQDFLADQDCHPTLINRVISGMDGREASDTEVWAALREALAFQPWDSTQAYRMAFVGPAGSGKTSATLKIALQSAHPYRIVDADASKIGSELRRTAALSGVECLSIEAEDLSALVAESGPFLVEVGARADKRCADALAQVPGLTVNLVLPATWRTPDLMAAASRYQAFCPSRLTFTYLDETTRAGGVLSVAALTGLPLFAFGCSPGPIGGIEPSGEQRLLDLLFQTQPTQMKAAAAGGQR